MVDARTCTVAPDQRQHFVIPGMVYVKVVRDGLRVFELCTSQLEAAVKGVATPLPFDSVFVCGTLMRGEECFAGLAEVAEFECILLATACGRMLDLGAYPAIISDTDHRVEGEFVRFRNIEPVLDHLDAIEGFHGYHAESLYYRVPITIDVGEGHFRPAWTYVRADSGSEWSVIASGNWLRRHGRHKSFMKALISSH